LNPLRVKNRMTVFCFMILKTYEQRFQILTLHLLDQKWSKTERFNTTRRIDRNMHKFIINFLKTQQDPEKRDRRRIYGPPETTVINNRKNIQAEWTWFKQRKRDGFTEINITIVEPHKRIRVTNNRPMYLRHKMTFVLIKRSEDSRIQR
jgi:hypothetical protein